MKTIGILGGMSAASTQLYYQHLCRLTQESLGGLHSPELLIRSLNFDVIERYQASDNWQAAAQVLNTEALSLERGLQWNRRSTPTDSSKLIWPFAYPPGTIATPHTTLSITSFART